MKLTEKEKYSDLIGQCESGIVFSPYIPYIFTETQKNTSQIKGTINIKSKSRYKFIKYEINR